MEFAEMDLRLAKILRSIGDSEASDQLTDGLQSKLSGCVAEFDPSEIQVSDPPRPEDFRQVGEFMIASRLLEEFYDVDDQQLAKLRSKRNELRKLFEKFRPQGRRGGGRRGGPDGRRRESRTRSNRPPE